MVMSLVEKENIKVSQIPYIQYLYDIHNKKIGAEVLSRLKIKNKTLPASYIFNDLRKYSFEKYIDMQKKFINHILTDIYTDFTNQKLLLFINLHIDDFIKSPSFFQFFINMLEINDNLEYLVLEITELSTNKKAFEKIIDKLKEIKKSKKLKIALDDFGTETSNFEKLYLVQPDIIKIDGMFIKRYSNEFIKDIIHNIVNLCRKHNINIVFEGIEEEKTLQDIKEFLSSLELKCDDFFQGFLFSNPSPY